MNLNIFLILYTLFTMSTAKSPIASGSSSGSSAEFTLIFQPNVKSGIFQLSAETSAELPVNLVSYTASQNLGEMHVRYGGSEFAGSWKYSDDSKEELKLIITAEATDDTASGATVTFKGGFAVNNVTTQSFTIDASS